MATEKNRFKGRVGQEAKSLLAQNDKSECLLALKTSFQFWSGLTSHGKSQQYLNMHFNDRFAYESGSKESPERNKTMTTSDTS